jgi:hypothetical protein
MLQSWKTAVSCDLKLVTASSSHQIQMPLLILLLFSSTMARLVPKSRFLPCLLKFINESHPAICQSLLSIFNNLIV